VIAALTCWLCRSPATWIPQAAFGTPMVLSSRHDGPRITVAARSRRYSSRQIALTLGFGEEFAAVGTGLTTRCGRQRFMKAGAGRVASWDALQQNAALRLW
jgi:hypothetical protein